MAPCERGVTPLRIRGAVVLEIDGKVALIRRHRADKVYYLFPGGGANEGETPEQAAVRETFEELGLHVEVERLVGVVYLPGEEQYYYTARVTGGTFGTGAGEEYSLPADAPQGRYTPELLTRRELDACHVLPWPLAEMLMRGELESLAEPLRIEGPGRRE